MSDQIALIEQTVYGVAERFNEVLSDKSIEFKREAEFAIQHILKNDFTIKIASSNRQSVIDAVTNVAAIGVSLNPARKAAYLVPREGSICLDISYRGLADMAIDSGAVSWVQAEIARKNDVFRLNGMGKLPTHEFDPFATEEERGEIVGVYVVAKTADGDYLTHAMSIGKVFSIRDRSDLWKKKKSGPWATDAEEMIKKTCVKQGCKYWPRNERTGRLDQAIYHLDNNTGEGLASIAEEEQSSVATKPKVAMPVAKQPTTKQQAQEPEDAVIVGEQEKSFKPLSPELPQGGRASPPASAGEVNWVRRKVTECGEPLDLIQGKAGVEMTGTLDGLTADDFAALRKVLV